MALINCPECGKEISDKAVACPHCGYSMDEYLKEQERQERVKREQEKAAQERVSYEQRISSVPDPVKHKAGGYIASVSFGLMALLVGFAASAGHPDERDIIYGCYAFAAALLVVVPILIYRYENKQYEKNMSDLSAYRKRVVNNQIAMEKIAENREKAKTVMCPKCESINLQYMGVKNVGARDAKMKTVTKVNLNPLKPFTVLEHKDKVIRASDNGTNYDCWRCCDCGFMFERKQKIF